MSDHGVTIYECKIKKGLLEISPGEVEDNHIKDNFDDYMQHVMEYFQEQDWSVAFNLDVDANRSYGVSNHEDVHHPIFKNLPSFWEWWENNWEDAKGRRC